MEEAEPLQNLGKWPVVEAQILVLCGVEITGSCSGSVETTGSGNVGSGYSGHSEDAGYSRYSEDAGAGHAANSSKWDTHRTQSKLAWRSLEIPVEVQFLLRPQHRATVSGEDLE